MDSSPLHPKGWEEKSKSLWKAGGRDNRKVLRWWEMWLRAAEGRKAPASHGFGRDREMVPGDTCSLAMSHGRDAASRCQAAQPQPSRCSSHSALPQVTSPITSQPWPQQRWAACPLQQRVPSCNALTSAGNSRAPALGTSGSFPRIFVLKRLCWSQQQLLPLPPHQWGPDTLLHLAL